MGPYYFIAQKRRTNPEVPPKTEIEKLGEFLTHKYTLAQESLHGFGDDHTYMDYEDASGKTVPNLYAATNKNA